MAKRKKRDEGEIIGISKEDCQWVYMNFANDEVDKDKAPSPGAYGLLLQAKDQKDIYKLVVDKLAPKTFFKDEDDNINRSPEDVADADPARKLVGLTERLGTIVKERLS